MLPDPITIKHLMLAFAAGLLVGCVVGTLGAIAGIREVLRKAARRP